MEQENITKHIEEIKKEIEEQRKLYGTGLKPIKRVSLLQAELQEAQTCLRFMEQELEEDIEWLKNYINETNKLRKDAMNKYGTLSKIPRDTLMLMRGDTIHRFEAKLQQKQAQLTKLKQTQNQNLGDKEK